MNNTLPHYLKFNSRHSIKNSLELIKCLKNIELPNNSNLVSFDVVSLFSSIPTLELINIIYTNLHSNSNLSNNEILEIKTLLNICSN